MQKYEKFHTDYTAYIDNLFNKVYATESTGIQASSSWHIPHHGIYYPHKPDKIWVLSKSKEEAVELVKDVKLMCKSGGFHLTKFLTNSKGVLEAVPACDRRKSVV